jgi:hypothetical protein
MKAIASLATIGQLFGVPATTRSWSTIAAIAKVLGARRAWAPGLAAAFGLWVGLCPTRSSECAARIRVQ